MLNNDFHNSVVQSLNILVRQLWSVFNELEKLLETGDIQKAKELCKEVKPALKEMLTWEPPTK